MYTFIFVAMSLIASTVGAIAGIGGGVIIRPVLDSFHILSAATISFLSGCTVLSMSCYSTVRIQLSGDNRLRGKIALPLGVGAAPELQLARYGVVPGATMLLADASLRADSVHANAAGYARFTEGLVDTLQRTGLLLKR